MKIHRIATSIEPGIRRPKFCNDSWMKLFCYKKPQCETFMENRRWTLWFAGGKKADAIPLRTNTSPACVQVDYCAGVLSTCGYRLHRFVFSCTNIISDTKNIYRDSIQIPNELSLPEEKCRLLVIPRDAVHRKRCDKEDWRSNSEIEEANWSTVETPPFFPVPLDRLWTVRSRLRRWEFCHRQKKVTKWVLNLARRYEVRRHVLEWQAVEDGLASVTVLVRCHLFSLPYAFGSHWQSTHKAKLYRESIDQTRTFFGHASNLISIRLN